MQENQGYIYIGSRGNPPGDFAAVWLIPAAKKKVASLERQAAEAQLAEPRRPREKEEYSLAEKRLAALRGSARQVSFVERVPL